MNDSRPHLAILGLRGVPAVRGGFDTFAQRLALHLVQGGWRVTVYCQQSGESRGDAAGDAFMTDAWQGITRIHVPSGPATRQVPLGFDWRCVGHVVDHPPDVVLTLGYRTGILAAKLRAIGVPNVIYMGALEWNRSAWSWPMRAFQFANKHAASWLGNRLVADHPVTASCLASHVGADKISMIPPGADEVEQVFDEPVRALGLTPGRYATLMSRPEREQSVLEIVRAFSAETRGCELAVVGDYQPNADRYHRAVISAASHEVRFLGALPDPFTVTALRAHARLHVHGQRHGGTSASLVEALGAGNPVLAHQNRYNYWVCGTAAEYFRSEHGCRRAFDELLGDPYRLREMAYGSRQRHRLEFRWERVLQRYEQLLFRMIRRPGVVAPSRYAEATSGLRLRDFDHPPVPPIVLPPDVSGRFR